MMYGPQYGSAVTSFKGGVIPVFPFIFSFPPQCPITGIALSDHGNSLNEGHQVTEVNSADSLGLRILCGTVQDPFVRILAYLEQAEWKETDVWYRDDYRIAWLTILHCSEGIDQPWEYAFWRYLGKHPDKLIPELVYRHNLHRDIALPKPPQAVKPVAKSAKAGA